MKRFLSPLVALTAGSAVVLGTHPALAHGTAAGGALGGLTHPLLGLDHLFMLMAAGTAASFISSQLLLWALGGAVIGAAAVGCAGRSQVVERVSVGRSGSGSGLAEWKAAEEPGSRRRKPTMQTMHKAGVHLGGGRSSESDGHHYSPCDAKALTALGFWEKPKAKENK